MKMNLFLIVPLVMSCFLSSAQDCSQSFYALKAGAKTVVTNYNAIGKATSVTESVVKTVKANGASYEAVIAVTTKNDKDKVIVDGKTFIVKCENGTIRLDISSMMMADVSAQLKNMDMTISGSGIDIPPILTEGMVLSNGTTEMKMGNNGLIFMNMQFDIKNRKVEKKESITTSAGTFMAYKITYDMDMKVLFNKSVKVIQWLVPSVGLVKTETYNQKGELEGSSQLTKLENI